MIRVYIKNNPYISIVDGSNKIQLKTTWLNLVGKLELSIEEVYAYLYLITVAQTENSNEILVNYEAVIGYAADGENIELGDYIDRLADKELVVRKV